MGKKNRQASRAAAVAAPKKAKIVYVERPFAGIPGEVELVAMRDILPAATMRFKLTAEYGGKYVTLVTVLPGMGNALVRGDGEIMAATQVQTHSGDASRDIAAAILLAVDLEPGNAVSMSELPEPGPRLQDIFDLTIEAEFELRDSLEFWLDPTKERSEEEEKAIEESRDGLIDTVAIPGVKGAYWFKMNREFVRWLREEDETELFDALARLHVKRECNLGEGSRFVGAFRSCGLVIPVFELAPGVSAEDTAKPAAEFAKKLEQALADKTPLDAKAGSARAGLVSRQVSLN